MHLYATTRGIKSAVDQVVRDLQAQYFEYYVDEKTKIRKMVQLAMRPIQLWEIVFPKQHLESVVKMMQPGYQNGVSNPQGYLKYGYGLFRKAMGIKKMPKLDLSNTAQRIIAPDPLKVVGVDFLGIKDDNIWADDTPTELGHAGQEKL